MPCHFCEGGEDFRVSHDGCWEEWWRRRAAGKCVACNKPGVTPEETWCDGCFGLDRAPYLGYPSGV